MAIIGSRAKLSFSFAGHLVGVSSQSVWSVSQYSFVHSLMVLQGALTSSSQSTQSTARQIWTVPAPAAPRRLLSSVWADSVSAPTAQTANQTASQAAQQSLRVAHFPTTSQHFLSRSCRISTWAVPKTPPTWTCSASITSSISSTWRQTCPTCSNTKGTSNTNRFPSRTTGARTSRSFSLRPFHSLVSKSGANSVFIKSFIQLIWLDFMNLFKMYKIKHIKARNFFFPKIKASFRVISRIKISADYLTVQLCQNKTEDKAILLKMLIDETQIWVLAVSQT